MLCGAAQRGRRLLSSARRPYSSSSRGNGKAGGWHEFRFEPKLRAAVGSLQCEYALYPGSTPSAQRKHLVLLHCSGSSHAQYTALAEALAPHRSILCVNSFGAGVTSAWPGLGRPLTLDDQAELVGLSIKAALGEERFDLVGHSHGGTVAVRYASSIGGGLVRSLSLVEPSCFTLFGEHTSLPVAEDKKREKGLQDYFNDALSPCHVSANRRFRDYAEIIHNYWLSSEEHDWASLSEDAQGKLTKAAVPHAYNELRATEAARGAAAHRDLEAMRLLARERPCELILSETPGVGSASFMGAAQAVFSDIGFGVATVAGGHLAPLTHPATLAEHLITNQLAQSKDDDDASSSSNEQPPR